MSGEGQTQARDPSHLTSHPSLWRFFFFVFFVTLEAIVLYSNSAARDDAIISFQSSLHYPTYIYKYTTCGGLNPED